MSYYQGNRSGASPGLLDDGPPRGEYYFWNSAVLWSTMLDYWRYTGDDTYNAMALQGLAAQSGDTEYPGTTFMPFNQTRGSGNDDQGFWAMAGLQAAELGLPGADGLPTWVDLAKNVFEALTVRWDLDADVCKNGGLRWMVLPSSAGYNYKNTISTAVLANLGARIARHTGNATYADWADKSWTWLTDIGFIDADSNVFDGAHVEKNCTDYNKVQFTYSAGVLIETAAFMYNHVRVPLPLPFPNPRLTSPPDLLPNLAHPPHHPHQHHPLPLLPHLQLLHPHRTRLRNPQQNHHLRSRPALPQGHPFTLSHQCRTPRRAGQGSA